MNGVAVRRLVLSGMLLTMALALHAAESLLPPLPVPGARLGLANAVLLLVVWAWGWREGAVFSVARVLLTALVGGRLGTPGFWLSAAGAAASVAVMGAARNWARAGQTGVNRPGAGRPGGGRLVALSVLGAVAHNLGQLSAARVLVGHPGVVFYLPALAGLGAAAGLAMGMLAQRALPAFTWLLESAGQQAGSRAERPVVAHPGLRQGLGLVGAVTLMVVLLMGAGAGTGWGGPAWRPLPQPPPLGATSPQGMTALPGAPVAVVMTDGRPAAQLALDANGTYRWSAHGVEMQLEVRDGRVRVAATTCPHKTCQRMGWASPGQSIICVPALTVIDVLRRPAGPAAPEPDGELDAISR